MRVHRSAETTPFFTGQQDLLREQLDQSLTALREAKNEMGLSSVELRRNTLESKYSVIELDRLSTNQQLATSQASIEDLERQLAEVPERLVTAKKSMPNQGADLLRDRLYELQVKSMELQSRYSESHPLVIAASDQLSEAAKVVGDQSEHREEATHEINPIHRELTLAMKREQIVVAGLKSRLVALDAQGDAVRAELQALNGHDIKIDQLTRESELARAKYLQYARTMEEARIDAELQKQNINNLSQAQEATLAEKPINPSKTLTAAGSICLAIGRAFAFVLLGELKRHREPRQHPTSIGRRSQGAGRVSAVFASTASQTATPPPRKLHHCQNNSGRCSFFCWTACRRRAGYRQTRAFVGPAELDVVSAVFDPHDRRNLATR